MTDQSCSRFKPKIVGVTAINTRYRFLTIKVTPDLQKNLRFDCNLPAFFSENHTQTKLKHIGKTMCWQIWLRGIDVWICRNDNSEMACFRGVILRYKGVCCNLLGVNLLKQIILILAEPKTVSKKILQKLLKWNFHDISRWQFEVILKWLYVFPAGIGFCQWNSANVVERRRLYQFPLRTPL